MMTKEENKGKVEGQPVKKLEKVHKMGCMCARGNLGQKTKGIKSKRIYLFTTLIHSLSTWVRALCEMGCSCRNYKDLYIYIYTP